MRFGASRSQIYDARQTAQARWDEVTNWWGDEAKRDHEERVWLPLDDAARRAVQAIDQLTALFHGVRAECEFTDE